MKTATTLALLVTITMIAAVVAPGQEDSALIRSRLHLAGELYRESRFAEALELYREIARTHPDDPKAYRGIKSCLLELKEYDELIALLEREVAQNPDNPATLEELGTAAARKGDREAALRHWLRILDAQEHSRGSYSFVSDLLTRHRMLDEALALYSEADSVYPGKFTRQKASLHELRFEFDDATREYLRFLESNPTALSYVEGRLLRIGENEEGLGPVIDRVSEWNRERTREAKQRNRQRPNDVVFRKLLGDLYLEAGDHENARKQYFHLVDDAPNQFSALLVFGKRCQADGQYEVAIRVFERILADFPNVRAVPSALTEIGSCQAALGRWDEALATYDRLATEYPETDFALAARYDTGVLLREGKRDPEAAEAVFRELISLVPGPWGEADPQFEIAECALWKRDLERAGGIYRAIRLRNFGPSTRERALYEEARAIFYGADFALADSLFKQVAMSYPEGAHVNDALEMSILINTNADGEEVLGKYAAAELALRTAVASEAIEVLEDLGTNHSDTMIVDEALLLLGRAYREAGQPHRALDTLERAVRSAQVMDLAAKARLARAEIFARDLADPAAALAEYEELLVTYPETLAADRARDLAADLSRRTLP